MKRGYMIFIGIVVVVVVLLMFLFRVNEEQVIVQRMIDFEPEPNSQVVWKDRESISAFEYAFRFGKRQQGRVDIDSPPYKVTLGKQHYYLYISEQYEVANFMKSNDTGTLYTIGKSSKKKLQTLLKNAYPVRASGSEGEAEKNIIDISEYEMEKQSIPPSMSPSPSAGELPSPFVVSPTPMPTPSSDLPSNEAFEPAYLDSSMFSEEEKPLIELINLRIQYLHENKWDDFLSLYTENACKGREDSGSFTGFTITSIKVEQEISIKEQRSLYGGNEAISYHLKPNKGCCVPRII